MITLNVTISITGETRRQFGLNHSQTIETEDPLLFVAAIKTVLDAFAPTPEPPE